MPGPIFWPPLPFISDGQFTPYEKYDRNYAEPTVPFPVLPGDTIVISGMRGTNRSFNGTYTLSRLSPTTGRSGR